ncbi:hypothetical protein ACFVUW_09400 [Streptomyces xiamenensis]|uniref:hypothetical protein n=1 Tax=Streptomyces xiamenensis TaxID=408015 RepID=UPI0036ED2511
MSAPLVEPLTTSAFRSVLQLRSPANARADRALVLIAQDGTALVGVPAGEWGGFDYPQPKALRMMGSVFARSGWVSLAERPDWVDVAVPDGGTGPQPAFRYSVSWQVSDPVMVLYHQITAADVPIRIARHIAENGMGSGGLHVVPDAGIMYRVLQQPATDPTGVRAAPPLPGSWDSGMLNAFQFFRELVSDDPRGLAAMWLLYHPQNAKQVLEWTVENRSLLQPPEKPVEPEPAPDSWERSLAVALRDLTAADRAFVGVNMARLLNDLGIPEAQEALARVEGQ